MKNPLKKHKAETLALAIGILVLTIPPLAILLCITGIVWAYVVYTTKTDSSKTNEE